MTEDPPFSDDSSTTTGVAGCAIELRARCDATGRFSVDDLVFVDQHLGSSLTPFTLIAVLHAALGVPVEMLRVVENWAGASMGGDMSSGEVVAVLDRWWTVSRGGQR